MVDLFGQLGPTSSNFSDLKWGSYGKNGDQPLKIERLVDLGTEHLVAILKNCHHIKGTRYELAIRTMLEC